MRLCSLPLVALLASACQAQIHVDASAPIGPPTPASFKPGSSRSPSGGTIGLNARYLTRDGKPWLPVMGEFHYSRVPESQWEEQILKMKAAGVDIIAAYVIWIHHEEVEGEWEWTGQRDLRRFAQLCAKHGMYFYPRIGPWVHAEVRNGGLPDWLLAKGVKLRSNDPAYMAEVDKFYKQIAAQLKGLMWKDGGPIIGIQLENEYAKHGEGQGVDHIRELKRLAIADGFDVPLYTVTGWNGAPVPNGDVLGVFGGYPATPWVGTLEMLPPQEVYAFRFGGRVTGNMGMMDAGKAAANAAYDYPFMTVEMGGGTEDTYHNRPVLQADEVAAMVPVMLGSGVNMYGSYMFQGGQNPVSKRTTLQESQATNYPNDMPIFDYDFQAPLGAYGDERPVLRKLKVFDYFMQEFGSQLAPLVPHAPNVLPSGPKDLSVARVSVRSDGDEGFLFFNNFVRDGVMPARKGFQVQVKLAAETVAVPATPIDLPSGAYGIWPIHIKLGKATLRYATAQPFTVIRNGKDATYYFVETPGVRARFAFSDADRKLVQVETKYNTHPELNGDEIVLNPYYRPGFHVDTADGGKIHVVLLTQAYAERSWKVDLPGKSTLLTATSGEYKPNPSSLPLTDAPSFYLDGNVAVLEAAGVTASIGYSTNPEIDAVPFGRPNTAERLDVIEERLKRAKPLAVTVSKLADAGEIGPVKLGPAPRGKAQGLALMPEEADWNKAARWSVKFDAKDFTRSLGAGDTVGAAGRELFLAVDYDGDVARLYSGGKLLADDFYNGQPWRVGLMRYRKQIEQGGLELRIMPRRLDAPVYLEPAARDVGTTGQVVTLKSVQLEPEYEIRLTLK